MLTLPSIALIQPPEIPAPVVYKETSKDETRDYLVSLRDRMAKVMTSSDSSEFMAEIQKEDVAPKQSILRQISGFFQTEKWKKSNSPTLGQSTSTDCECKSEGKAPGCGDDPCKCPTCKDPQGKKPPPREKGPELKAPNDTEVELMLQLLDYMHEGRATFQSGDLKKITGREGVNAHDFFAKHARNFRAHPSSVAKPEAAAVETTQPKTTDK